MARDEEQSSPAPHSLHEAFIDKNDDKTRYSCCMFLLQSCIKPGSGSRIIRNCVELDNHNSCAILSQNCVNDSWAKIKGYKTT